MGRRGAALLLVLTVAACGGRSGLVGGAPQEDLGDASMPVTDATFVDVPAFEDAATSDALINAPDASCTMPSVSVGHDGPQGNGPGCKFQVVWTCGNESIRVGGGCDPVNFGPDDAGGSGACYVNGQEVGTFMVPPTMCTCDDSAALAAFAKSLCPPVHQ